MITLEEMKEWLRIYNNDEDINIKILMDSSIPIIKSATGISREVIESTENRDIKDLYLMVQRILITDLYNERDTENMALTSYYIQLELAYKAVLA